MKKGEINWARIENLKFNRKTFKAWCKLLEKESGSNEYYNTNILILEDLNKSIESVSADELQEYFDKLIDAANTKNKKIAALKRYFEYLKTLSEYRGKDFDILPGKYDREEKSELNAASPLTIDEFIDLRNQIMSKKANHRWALSLELFYVFGYKLEELKTFTKSNFDFQTGIFQRNGKAYILSNTMIDLLVEHPNIIDMVSTQDPHSMFGSMSSKFRRKIKWLDINAMYYKYSMCCPICGERFASDLDYWVIAKRADDNLGKKWFVCCNCYERLK